ncbi:hypothetical protein Nepgr_000017 [Nepenthes gracilis]|uniref:Methyltransferase FkbM domain-containing protein n=1 Tax=Nepenthes gracilis TaxID=150966 RepID=A0AAD3P4I8_NEPGR|nr:hypothetical protein Nepgr_000017 [Nepenthes gracilis]
MDPTLIKTHLLKNPVVQILVLGVLVFLFRFASIVILRGGSCDGPGDFCFFSAPQDPGLRNNIVSIRNSPPSASQRSIAVLDIWTTVGFRMSVSYYSSIFQDLISEGSLSLKSNVLCVETPVGSDVVALRELGVHDVVGLSSKISLKRLIVSGHAYRQPFDDNIFDFEFSGNAELDRSSDPFNFASEIVRTLKPGGFAVIHTKTKDLYSFHSILNLFNSCTLISAREIAGPDPSLPSFREIVLKKGIVSVHFHEEKAKCCVPEYKRESIKNAEPLIEKEPSKPWLTLKRYLKKVRYLPTMFDLSFKQRYAYVDVGARSYESSIGSWFRKQYPKQNKSFEIYAIEADTAFHEEYRSKGKVTLLPYAAWVRNETLFFEINRKPTRKIEEKGRGIGRIQPVQSSTNFVGNVDKIRGFDFASWLKSTFSERDFLVVKMDVEGTEFHLIPRLIESGAICLIDEMFLECHYNRWQKCCPGVRSPKYQRTYAQCFRLFFSLRESGVLVHQWW